MAGMDPDRRSDSTTTGVEVEDGFAPGAASDWAGLLLHEPRGYLRRVPGRETFLWTGPEGAGLVVKRFGVESRLARLRETWRDRFAGRGRRGPARRERDALRLLTGLGLRVPRPVALIEGRTRSAVVMEHVPHEQTLREAAPGKDLEEALLTLVLGLHRAGAYHRDLYLHHLVLDSRRPGPEGLTLLDCGRVRIEPAPRRRWFEKDLAALALWLKEEVGTLRRLRFLLRYLDDLGIEGREARRAFARGVESRRLRMAGHRPRHGEGPCEDGTKGRT